MDSWINVTDFSAKQRHGHRFRGSVGAAVLVTALVTLAVPAAAHAVGKKRNVTLMTRNVYIGTDATRPLSANNLDELFRITTGMFREVEATDFRTRARALAKEIDKANPDLVGLQEVALIRTDTPADGPPSLGGTPALEVLHDYLKILTRKLRERGARYKVVRVQEGADAEVPTTLGFDARATDRDVILAKRTKRVRTHNDFSDRFERGLEGSLFGGTVRFRLDRGWTATAAHVGRASFHLVNTHLEAADALVRRDQARELVAPSGPATATKPVVLLGDLNSDDDSVRGNDRLAYGVVTNAGFVSRSTSAPSCCYQSPTLDDPSEKLDHQVDHILVNDPGIKLVRSYVTGTDPRKRIGGLWPSDHGGVVSTLQLKK
jgi:endonuclease/exonuclease/phosphatase family metal-dependent hydrolase